MVVPHAQIPPADTAQSLLTPTQLNIIAALQVAPRAPHSALAEVLDIPRSTLTRQILHLIDSKLVRLIGRYDWPLVTDGMPSQLWIRCHPGCTRKVLDELRRFNEIQFLILTTGSIDIYADIYPLRGSDIQNLTTSVIPAIPGISSIQTHLVLKTTKVGQSWRLNRLSEAQVTKLEQFCEPVVREPFADISELSGLEYRILRRLGSDIRVSSGELARTLSVSSSTVYRTIQTLLQSGAVSPRVEIEPAALGYGLNVIIAMQVDPRAIPAVLEGLTAHPSSRMVSMVTGSASVVYSGVFRNENELAQFIVVGLGELDGIRALDVSVGRDVVRRYWMDRSGVRLGEQKMILPPHSEELSN